LSSIDGFHGCLPAKLECDRGGDCSIRPADPALSDSRRTHHPPGQTLAGTADHAMGSPLRFRNMPKIFANF
jgi:hypothetical protein